MTTVRRATPSDRSAIESVYERTVGAPFTVSDDEWLRCLSSKGIVVAEQNDGVIGFGGIDVSAREQLRWIFLLPEFQGGGVGSKILSELEAIAWSCGLQSIRLHSAPGAFEFYLNRGYERVPDNQEFGHDHDGVEMIKLRQNEVSTTSR